VILMVDNYDSFTYNLVQALAAAGARVEVLRNDAATADEMLARRPAGMVLSPGPGRPESAGICLELLARRSTVPVLGVCLGHQAMGVACGATVDRAPELMHGKTSWVHHSGEGLFAGLSDPFEATRYHSLEVVAGTLPDELEPVAWTVPARRPDGAGPEPAGGGGGGTLMAVRHRELPWWGVQFHPESVLTVEGPRLLANFLALCGEIPAAAVDRAAAGAAASGAGQPEEAAR
jgi:para-aminobenzoate synthetase component 2